MTNKDLILEAIKIIEKNLKTEISVSDVTDKIGYSITQPVGY